MLTRIEQYGVDPVKLGSELLMREGWGGFDDFIADVETRYGEDEAQRVRETMKRQTDRDYKTQDLGGRQGVDQLIWRVVRQAEQLVVAR